MSLLLAIALLVPGPLIDGSEHAPDFDWEPAPAVVPHVWQADEERPQGHDPEVEGDTVFIEACPDGLPGPGAGDNGYGPRWSAEFPSSVTQWEPLVAEHFFGECTSWAVTEALRILACESVGDASAVNPSSGTAGLFQHHPAYWAERSASAGWGGYSPLDPEANVAVASWLWREAGGWWDWHCRP